MYMTYVYSKPCSYNSYLSFMVNAYTASLCLNCAYYFCTCTYNVSFSECPLDKVKDMCPTVACYWTVCVESVDDAS